MRPDSVEERHMLEVLRLADGDEVEVFDGEGRAAVARLVLQAGRAGLHLEIVRPLPVQTEEVEKILVVALPKGKRMDLVVEKAAELGVSQIRPVITERVIARPEGERAAQRIERWRRIALSAAKQCGRETVLSVGEILPLPEVLTSIGRCDLFLVGSLAPDARPLREALAPWRKRKPGSVAVLIGPEGDLSAGELQAAASAGAVAVSFGKTVLRVETAAIFAAAVLAYEFSSNRPPAP